MLNSLEIIINTDDKNLKFNQHLGSLLHGVLMQQVDPAFAEFLHKDSLKPYSQYYYYDKENDHNVWKINTITEESKEKIINPVVNKLNGKIHIEHKDVDMKIIRKVLSESESYKDLADQYYIQNIMKRRVVIKFMTPTSFKVSGKYIIFPEIYNIYNSLLNKWNSFASEVSLQDQHILDHLTQNTEMIGYNLRSTKFDMEGVKINAFKGEVCLYIRGPESLVRIANLLFAFGEYSGVGVKCALGMGGIKVE